MPQFTLQSGEAVVTEKRPSVSATWPFYIFTLGLYEFWRRRKRFILTNQRVVVSQGVISRSVSFVPLDRVQDATIKNTLWVASVRLTSAGGALGVEQLTPMRTRDAREFVEMLTPRLGGGLTQGGLVGPPPTISAADELNKLVELHEKGALTDEEFNAQKAKLLAA